ncbi:hypothetical protein L596_018999 [Steinernema carpocapsae]|uniref:Peroxin-19 n=1 Tax=Steinernema carpocapsae TaxID=34508 RepID=A0A4U5N795_STECR|nr:hypothetical protein L596_018999 [Steinernema carpocapsae]
MDDCGEQKSQLSPKPSGSGSNETNTEDLSALLDSALADFGKQRNTDDELDTLMNEMDQAAAQKAAKDFETMLKQMIQVQEEAGKNASDEVNDSSQAAEMRSFAEAMSRMAQSSGDIANAPDEKAFLESMMKMGSDESAMEPFMGMMMEAFMTKDVMYPPMKELLNGFPAYLETNKDSLDAQTLERYLKQQETLENICAEYETETDDSDQAASRARFERLGAFLIELQTYGYPPNELAGDLPAGFAMDNASGLPKLLDASKAAESCSIM